MRKLFIGALTSIALLLGLGSAASLAEATPTTSVAVTVVKPGPTATRLAFAVDPGGKVVPLNKASAKRSAQSLQACTSQPDGKCYWYSDGKFAQRNICFQNNLGVYWNYLQAEAGFTSGTSTVNFYNHGASTGTPTSCAASGGWNVWQILTYQAYGVNDGHCAKFYADVDSSGYYNSGTTIYMNAAPDRPVTCTDTLQHRNNSVSTAIGTIIGLEVFSSSSNLTAAVMNHYFVNSYNYPGVDDRNALYWLYLMQ